MKKQKVLKATHSGELNIWDLSLPCYVLEDGSRVLTQTTVTKALGIGQFRQLPEFLSQDRFEPFIPKGSGNFLKNKKIFKKEGGGKLAHGYNAIILAEICDVILQARKEGALHRTQMHIAESCEMLTRSFAKVGIIALVDEATGYQYDRGKDALSKILEAYIAKELLPWTKKFPDEFYEQLFKLRGWEYPTVGAARPGIVGKWTNDIVYERMPEGVLNELRKQNPKDEKGRFKNRHHQYLTPTIGNSHLEKHLTGVIALMRASSSWSEFKNNLQRAYPKMGEQMEYRIS